MMLSLMFCYDDDENYWAGIISIFPSIIIGISIYLGQEMRYYFLVSKKFNNTTFSVHPKRQRIKNPKKHEIITYKNRIIYKVKTDPSDEGEIVLNIINLKYGDGFHNRSDLENISENINNEMPESIEGKKVNYSAEDQFGFYYAIATKKKIFVEHPYIKPDEKRPPYGTKLYQASIWIRDELQTSK